MAALPLSPVRRMMALFHAGSLALKALRYYRDECSGAEPSLSVFHRMVDEALVAAGDTKEGA